MCKLCFFFSLFLVCHFNISPHILQKCCHIQSMCSVMQQSIRTIHAMMYVRVFGMKLKAVCEWTCAHICCFWRNKTAATTTYDNNNDDDDDGANNKTRQENLCAFEFVKVKEKNRETGSTSNEIFYKINEWMKNEWRQ